MSDPVIGQYETNTDGFAVRFSVQVEPLPLTVETVEIKSGGQVLFSWPASSSLATPPASAIPE
jgi:hypothetical protein